jgi:hypothetical protein
VAFACRIVLAFRRALGFDAWRNLLRPTGRPMDQLIADIAAKTGVPTAAARQAIAIIVAFLAREAPADKVNVLLDKLPGARELAKESTGRGSGLMGVFNDLTGSGLGMGGVQTAAKMFGTYARSKAGDRDVDAVIRSIPGLSQFV